MRNGLVRIGSALVFASTMAAVLGCGGGSSGGGSGGAGGGSGSGGGGSGGANGRGGSGGADAGSSSCASDGGAGSVTSICASKAVNTLTAAEATQLCSDTRAYFARSITMATSCKFAALVTAASSSSPTEAGLRAACSNALNTCNQPDSGAGPGASTSCNDIPSTCTATVADYSACIRDKTTAFNQGVGALPGCATLTYADLTAVSMIQSDDNASPSCMALQTTCPDFFPPTAN
jgi:hypothetical protein